MTNDQIKPSKDSKKKHRVIITPQSTQEDVPENISRNSKVSTINWNLMANKHSTLITTVRPGSTIPQSIRGIKHTTPQEIQKDAPGDKATASLSTLSPRIPVMDHISIGPWRLITPEEHVSIAGRHFGRLHRHRSTTTPAPTGDLETQLTLEGGDEDEAASQQNSNGNQQQSTTSSTMKQLPKTAGETEDNGDQPAAKSTETESEISGPTESSKPHFKVSNKYRKSLVVLHLHVPRRVILRADKTIRDFTVSSYSSSSLS